MKNQNLTDSENHLYHAPDENENIFGLDMVVRICSRQRCIKCGSTFKQTSRGLVCPNHFNSKPNYFYLDWYFKGERFKLYGLDSLNSAVKKAATIDQEIKDHKFRPENYKGQRAKVNKKYAFDSRYSKWIEIKKLSVKPAYYRKLKQYEKEFISFFSCEDIRVIGNDRIESYYESLIGKAANKTIYNKLGVLHSFFKALHDREAIHTLPRFPKVKFKKSDPAWISEQEQTQILNAMPEKHHAIFKFLFETGCRHGEARALHWDNIDYDNSTITIKHNFSDSVLTTPKTGKERKIPLKQTLKEVLLKHPRTLRSPFVFVLNGKPYYESSLGKIWRAACKKAGIENITAYSGTRHSFASHAINDGYSLEIIGEVLGHSDIRTTKKYAHVSMDAMRKLMERK